MTENEGHIVVLSQLEVGKHEFRLTLDDVFFHAITPTELLGGNVEVEATLNLMEDGYRLWMHVLGQVSVTCDRCLDAMAVDVDAEDTLMPDADEDTEDRLDLAWLAYELIIINLPLVHSHQPGGCNPAMDKLLQDHLCTELEEPEE